MVDGQWSMGEIGLLIDHRPLTIPPSPRLSLIRNGNNDYGAPKSDAPQKVMKMNMWQLIVPLIIFGIVAGHIAHIVVTSTLFEGLRRRVTFLGESRGGAWACFSDGFHCQLCSEVWYSGVISIWWTVALYIFRPALWDQIAERPLGWISVPAWISLFIAQAFFMAAVGHAFRELVGLLEDHRSREEEEVQILERAARRMSA